MTTRQEVRLRLELSGLDGVAAVAPAEGGQVARVGGLRQIGLARERVVGDVVRHDDHVVRPVGPGDHRGLGVGRARAGGDLLAGGVVDVHVEVLGGLLPLDGDRHTTLRVVVPVAVGSRHGEVEAVADLVVRVLGGRRTVTGAADRALGIDGALPRHALVGVIEHAARRGLPRGRFRRGRLAERRRGRRQVLPRPRPVGGPGGEVFARDTSLRAGCLQMLEHASDRATSRARIHHYAGACQRVVAGSGATRRVP